MPDTTCFTLLTHLIFITVLGICPNGDLILHKRKLRQEEVEKTDYKYNFCSGSVCWTKRDGWEAEQHFSQSHFGRGKADWGPDSSQSAALVNFPACILETSRASLWRMGKLEMHPPWPHSAPDLNHLSDPVNLKANVGLRWCQFIVSLGIWQKQT